MRRFDSRRQSDTESLVEYETALRILYKEAWPDAPNDQRDAALKRRFEDGVSSVELSQYLRLHHRSLDFAQTVEQARIYAATMDSTKPKKAVRFAEVNEPAVNLVTSSAVDLTPLVTQLEAVRSSLDKLQTEKQSARPVSPSTQQPAQRRLMPPPQSPSQQARQQQPQSTRFGGSSQWRGGPGQRPPQRNQPPPPGRFVSQATSPTPPQQSAPRASGFGPWFRGRARRGCYVCGRYGCHTVNHDQGDERFNRPSQDRPRSASVPTARVFQGNGNRSPSPGNRASLLPYRPQSR